MGKRNTCYTISFVVFLPIRQAKQSGKKKSRSKIAIIEVSLNCFFKASKSINQKTFSLLEKRQKLNVVIKNLTEECDELNKDIRLKYMQMKVLVEETRKSIVRIKNLPEKKDENVYEKARVVDIFVP